MRPQYRVRSGVSEVRFGAYYRIRERKGRFGQVDHNHACGHSTGARGV